MNKLKFEKPGLVDNLVGVFSPRKKLERLAAKHTLKAIAGGGYTGASRTRKALQGYNPGISDANSDIVDDLKTLRARGRDLVRNNPLARSAALIFKNSVVGTGLEVSPALPYKFLNMELEEAQEWAEKTKFLFKTWAENPNAIDFNRTSDFSQLQSLAVFNVFQSGDIFGLLPMEKREGQTIETRVRLIEADYISNPNGQANNDKIIEGIELDEYGRPLAVHISKKHPNSKIRSTSANEWQRVDILKNGRRNVIHLMDPDRVSQLRGVPWIAPVIEKLKQLDRYSDAELTASVVSAMFTIFIKQPMPSEGGLLSDMIEPEESISQSAKDLEMAPGAVLGLGEGEEIQSANPNRPNAAFEGFISAITSEIGSALGLPAEVLTKQFNSSYSASRAAFLEAWKTFKSVRKWLVSGFCQPVYMAWLEEMVARGVIDAPGFFDSEEYRFAWGSTTWRGDAPGQIDTLKETKAAILQMEAGIKTGEDITPELFGTDYSKNIQRVAFEADERDKLNLKPLARPEEEPEDATTNGGNNE
jgi:lambda family phage portal protein